MSEYSESTRTSERTSTASGYSGSDRTTGTSDRSSSVTDASSRAERGDLTSTTPTEGPDGNDRPDVGAEQSPTDDHGDTREKGTPTPDGRDGGGRPSLGDGYVSANHCDDTGEGGDLSSGAVANGHNSDDGSNAGARQGPADGGHVTGPHTPDRGAGKPATDAGNVADIGEKGTPTPKAADAAASEATPLGQSAMNAAGHQTDAYAGKGEARKGEHLKEPPIPIVRTTPAGPAERGQESRVANGEVTPAEALKWFQDHGVPVHGLPHWDADRHMWMFPDQTGGLGGPAAPHPGTSTVPDAVTSNVPNSGPPTAPGRAGEGGMPAADLKAAGMEPQGGQFARLLAVADVLWEIAKFPTPGTPEILDIRRVLEFGYARQGFVAGMTGVPLDPPVDPQDKAEWDRGQQVAMLVVLAEATNGFVVPGGPGGPGAGQSPAFAGAGGGRAATEQPTAPRPLAYEARGGKASKELNPKEGTKATEAEQQKPDETPRDHDRGRQGPLVPGSAAHKLQRWIDYQKRHNVSHPTSNIDSWWSAKYDNVITNKGTGSQVERELLEALGFPKNKAVMIDKEGNGFIPDAIKGEPDSIAWGESYTFIEVKDWADMSHTGNVKAMLDYVAQFEGSKLILYSRNGSYMSGNLVERLDTLRLAGKVEIRFF